MSTQALALSVEEESPSQKLVESTGITVTATITVTAGAGGLAFSSSNPLVKAHGTDIKLEPTSSTEGPVTYNLIFVAGEGIASFEDPAAEISIDGIKARFNVSPATTTSFSMTFVNDLPVGHHPIPIEFFVNWETPLLELFRSEDPTIILDPPKS
jgi:hypothetical protein